jgi:hypothetical protein
VPFTHEAYLKAGKCMRTHWLLNIYRRGHESAATASFNKKKAHDLCIAIAKTWRLRKMKKLPLSVRQKLDDDIFVSFSLLIYFMLYGVKDFSDRADIFNFLRKRVPKLKFTHGVKQRVTSMMYRFMPHVYFFFRLVFKWVTQKPNFG